MRLFVKPQKIQTQQYSDSSKLNLQLKPPSLARWDSALIFIQDDPAGPALSLGLQTRQRRRRSVKEEDKSRCWEVWKVWKVQGKMTSETWKRERKSETMEVRGKKSLKKRQRWKEKEERKPKRQDRSERRRCGRRARSLLWLPAARKPESVTWGLVFQTKSGVNASWQQEAVIQFQV